MKKKASFISVALLLATVLVLYQFLIQAPQKRLDRFLLEIAKVEVGKTKLDIWRKQVDQAHLPNSIFHCEGQSCNISWRGDNMLLHKLRLAPLTTVEASVEFKDGIASEIYIRAEIADAPDAAGAMFPGTGATVHQTGGTASCSQHYSANLKEGGNFHWGTVSMDSCVSSEERANAFAVDSSCLTRLGGCKTIEAIIPHVLIRR